MLQREIFLIISGKIQGFCFGRNPFAGIIFKPAAFVINGFYTFFGTENLVLLQTRAIQTIAAGTFDLFTKQHTQASEIILLSLYRNKAEIAIPISFFSEKNQD